MELDKSFEFGLTVCKARRDEEGRMIVTGYGSDTMTDGHKEKFDTHAIKGMLDAVRNGVPLMTSHKDSFGFGESFDGRIVPLDSGEVGLEVDFLLKEKYPQATDLFEAIQSGKCDQQLSVGGKLNMSNPRAAYLLRDGTKVLHDFDLDHFCTTRPKKAANPRTHFKAAMFESLEKDGMTDEVWKTLEVDDSEAERLAQVGGSIEKFLMLSPSMDSPMTGSVNREDDPLDGNDRSFEDLPSFKQMRDAGYNAYHVPLYWEGHPVQLAMRDVRMDRKKCLENVGRYKFDEIEPMVRASGVKNPVVDSKGMISLYGDYSNVGNMDDRPVGKDPTGKRAVRYYRMFPSAINNDGELEYDDLGRLKGGGFLFMKDGRKVPGEDDYSPFWRVPSMTEAQVLIPDAVAKLAETTEKSDLEDTVEKSINLTRTLLMPLSLRKIKLRTKPTDDHSHELRLFLDSSGKVVDGYTFDGGSSFAHGRRAQATQDMNDRESFRLRHDHVHIVVFTGGKAVLAEALGHTHEYELPEMEKETSEMEFHKEKVRHRTVNSGGYFAVGEKGIGAEVYEEAPKSADLTQTGQSSYALLLESEHGQHIRQLGKISRAEAQKMALGAVKPEGGKVVVGRSIGRLNNRNLYRMLSEFSPADGKEEAEKAVPFRSYPLSGNRRWSFTANEGNAILNQFGGEDSERAWKAYENAHAWYNSDAGNGTPRTKGAYALPHHKLEDGSMRTFPGGVIAAMAALNGARGGVTRIPANERQGVYNHLSQHYRQMDMTPPDLRGAKEGYKEDIGVGETDSEYLDQFINFHKEQGVDLDWLPAFMDEFSKSEEEVDKMGGEEKKKDETTAPPVEETAVDETTDDKETEAPKEEAKQEETVETKTDTGLLEKFMVGLGLKKAPNPKVERTLTLMESAQDALEGVEIGEDDAAPLIGQMAKLVSMVKAGVEAGKIDLDDLPARDARLLKAFLDGNPVEAPKEAPKPTPKEEEPEETDEKAESAEIDYDKLADKLAEKFDLKPKEAGEDAGDAPKEEEAPEDSQDEDKEEETDTKEKSAPEDTGTVEKSEQDDALAQILNGLNDLSSRIEKVENVSGVSKSLDGQEGGKKKPGKGIFSGAIPHVHKARQIQEAKKQGK